MMKFLTCLAVTCVSCTLASKDNTLSGFKQQNHLKDDAVIALQTIAPQASSLVLGDQHVSMLDKDLIAVNSYTENALIMIDDQVQPPPLSTVYQSRQDPAVFLTKDPKDGRLLSAFHQDLHLEVLPLTMNGQSYATIHRDHYDSEKLSRFTAEASLPPIHRQLSMTTQNEEKDKPVETSYLRRSLGNNNRRRKNNRNRGVNNNNNSNISTNTNNQGSVTFGANSNSGSIGSCSSYGYDVIEVSVVMESGFCQAMGGESSARATVEAIVQSASSHYEVDGLCKRLQISSIIAYCNSGRDPIQQLRNSMTSNDAYGLLEQFGGYVRDQSIGGDIVHLFHGFDLSGGNIGQAYTGDICQLGWNTGVDEMTWTSSTSMRGLLLAHETGHILSLNHDSSATDIMYSSISAESDSFSSSGMSQINKTTAKASCVSHSNS